MSDFDPRHLRSAFGHFMTGVTVVTTLDPTGSPSGFTANSFTSLSLDPPLLLFSVGKDSNTFEDFDTDNGFVVHVLGADQQDLAVRFAAKGRGVERFDEVPWSRGVADLPILEDALVTFECSREHAYEGGDHLILVGRIERLTMGDPRPALGYFRGDYISQP